MHDPCCTEEVAGRRLAATPYITQRVLRLYNRSFYAQPLPRKLKSARAAAGVFSLPQPDTMRINNRQTVSTIIYSPKRLHRPVYAIIAVLNVRWTMDCWAVPTALNTQRQQFSNQCMVFGAYIARMTRAFRGHTTPGRGICTATRFGDVHHGNICSSKFESKVLSPHAIALCVSCPLLYCWTLSGHCIDSWTCRL